VVAQVLGKIKHERTSRPNRLFCKALALSFRFFSLPFVFFLFFAFCLFSFQFLFSLLMYPSLPLSIMFSHFPIALKAFLSSSTCDDVAKRLKNSLRFKEMLEGKMVKRKQHIGWPTGLSWSELI
jgi:hypothetical protein